MVMSTRNKAKVSHRAFLKAELGYQDERDNTTTRYVTSLVPTEGFPNPSLLIYEADMKDSSSVSSFSRTPLRNPRVSTVLAYVIQKGFITIPPSTRPPGKQLR